MRLPHAPLFSVVPPGDSDGRNSGAASRQDPGPPVMGKDGSLGLSPLPSTSHVPIYIWAPLPWPWGSWEPPLWRATEPPWFIPPCPSPLRAPLPIVTLPLAAVVLGTNKWRGASCCQLEPVPADLCPPILGVVSRALRHGSPFEENDNMILSGMRKPLSNCAK